MAALTHTEAQERARLLTVTSYEIELDLDQGEETFHSRTTLRFACAEPGSSTFVDLKAVSVERITLNGAAVDPATVADERLVLRDLAAENELVVEATMRFSRDGQGLHRAIDPADGQAYVYGHLFLDAAPRVYACFDQPDLKAPYDILVRAPQDWIVLGNGAATRTDDGRWRLATTRPLATYFVTVCAGPYATVTATHDGIDIGLHARASLAEPLRAQADELLSVTRAGFDFYHGLFGIRYPFGEYHQVFVPEFNAGAMENPGCVTFRDQMIFRGAAGDAERMSRANTVLHEMAHMWFGDLVTMRWWDDLWLNESFAEYMAIRAAMAATPFTGAWADFTILRKCWGYSAERSPSTHPVAGNPPPDAASALQNFDGISYAKGASVLAQLVAYLGEDTFDEGVRRYLTAHAYGNAALADFLQAMEEASGRDLSAWARSWLQTAGLDAISVDLRSEGDRISSAHAHRELCRGDAADRPHAIEVTGFDNGREVWRVPVVLDKDEVELPGVAGASLPPLVVPDAGSRTWATVRLSPQSLSALPAELPLVADPLTRAVVWAAVVDGVADAVVDPRTVITLAEATLPVETDSSLLQGVIEVAVKHLLRLFLPAEERAATEMRLGKMMAAVAASHEPGTSSYLTATRARASWTDDEDWLRAFARGDIAAEPLAGDTDVRWIAVTTLARRGAVDLAFLDEQHAADQTMAGGLAYLTARAALPGAQAKAWAWEQIVGGGGRSNYELKALAAGFWQIADPGELREYADRYFVDVPAMTGTLGEDALAYVARLTFPATVAEQEVADAARARLAGPGLGSAVRRQIVDGLAVLDQVLDSRRRFG